MVPMKHWCFFTKIMGTVPLFKGVRTFFCLSCKRPLRRNVLAICTRPCIREGKESLSELETKNKNWST